MVTVAATGEATAGGWWKAGSGAAWRPLAPASLFYLLFFGVPMASLFVIGFWRTQGFTLVPDFTLDNYLKIAASPLHRALILRTIVVGLVTSLIVVPIAWLLTRIKQRLTRPRI